ncbi:type I restriction enzyme, S subunit [Chitinophaga sancti]|nr:type I restriction enzyme, S subunit [Chitinophaga sancti]
MNEKTEINVLPEGWHWVKLSEITLPVSRVNKLYEDANTEFTYIDIDSINNSVQEIQNAKILTWRNAPSRAQQIVKTNDILFATVRPYLKNISLVNDRYDNSIASSGFCVIRTCLVNPLFIYYYVTSQHFIESINQFSKGTSYPSVTNKVVLDQKIPLPSLEVQNQIVDKISTLLDELNEADMSLRHASRLCSIYEYVTLKDAFDGKLSGNWRKTNNVESAYDFLTQVAKFRKETYDRLTGEGNFHEAKKFSYDFEFAPNFAISSWATAKLDKLIKISARVGWKGLKKEEYTQEGPLLLSVHSLNYGKIVKFDEANHISEYRYNESPEIMLKLDDILLCKDGAGIGKVAIIKHLPSEATVNSSLLVIRAEGVFKPDFLYYLFKGPRLQQLVNERISGSAIPHLFQKDIKEFTLSIPPLPEQEQIVEEIEYRFALIDNLKAAIRRNENMSKTLREVVLNNAFAGKMTTHLIDSDVAELLSEIKKTIDEFSHSQRELQNSRKIKPKSMEEKKTILQVLEAASGPLPAKDVWLRSKHKDDIESFYSELREIQNKIIETKKDTESLLSLRHEN